MKTKIRKKLIKLYKEMADLTLPECRQCRVPLSCCSSEYCQQTIEIARQEWGVSLPVTNHSKLPLMGPQGCTAEPHLRPQCTLHTCDINSLGMKKGDLDWTEKYFKLREEIEELENALYLT